MPRPRRTRPPVVPAVALPLALLFALWTWPSAAAPTPNVPAPNVPSPAVAAPGAPSVTGQVLGSGGVPLAGVTVRFAPLASAYGVESALWEGREPEPPLAEGRTDVAGRFAWQGMQGMFRVTVLAEGFVPMTFPVLPLVDDLALPPVVLHPAETARVETVDAAGRPLRGIGVMARSADRSLFEQPEKSAWRPAPRRGWTDAGGVLDLVRGRGERLDLFAHAPGDPTPVEALGVRRARLVLGAHESSTPLRLRGEAGDNGVVVAAVPGTGWPVARLDGGSKLDLASTGELLLVAEDGRRLRVDLSATPGPIALAEPATVTGVVRSVAGDSSSPLAGALVWPSHDPGAAVLTDGEGRFRLRAGAGDRFRIQAHAPGHVAAARRVEAKAEGHPVGLQLHPARRVAGRVIDGAGIPLAGVSLRADAAGEPTAMVFDAAAARATTDAEGRFELVGLDPARPHGLLARRHGFAPWNGSLDPTPQADSPGDLDIVLIRGRLAYGRVVDLDDRPIPGATVRVRPHGASESMAAEDDEPAARADAEGRFELRGLPGLHLDVVAVADGFAPLEVKGVQVADGDGPVDLGTLLLAPGVELRGFAFGPEGVPVAEAEAWVLADGAADDRPSSPAAARADAKGRLAVAGLEAGRTVDLLVDAPGFLPQRLRGLVPPAAFEAKLRPAASLGGRVVDRAGAPIEGAEVSVAVAETEVVAGAESESESDGAAISVERRRTVRSDAEGRFLLADVPPGPAEVEAWATGFQPTAPQRLDLSPEQTPRLRLVLDAGAAVVGRVVDVEGEPVEGARVNAGRPWGETDADGHYRLAGIPPSAEALEVTAVHPGYAAQRTQVEIVSEVTTVDFVLDGGRRVAGRVVDGAGAPLPGVALHLVPADPDSPLGDHRATSDGDGGFELAPVPDGHYRLRGSRGGLVQGDPPDVQVAGASVDGIELELAAGARLEGQILGLDFEAMARLELRAEADGRAPLAGEVDFEGRYRIADLAPDDWTVIARLDAGRRQVRARFTVEAAEPLVERDLEFGAGAQLTGTVLHGSEPLAGAQLELRHSVAGRRAVTTDPQGQFRVEDLDLGRYRLSVAHRERGLVHNEDLSLQGDRDVVVELATSGAVGQVVDGVTGAGVGGASVVFQQELPGGASGSIFTAGTDGGGTFRQERLPPGSYRVEVRRNDYQVVEERVQVPAGAAVEGLRFEIQPAAGLDVVVQLSSGAPPGYITLRGQGAGGRTFAETRASVDGGAPFSTLPPGRWRLWVGATGGAAVERSVEVPSEPLAVVLPDAGRLRVRVPSLVDAEAVASLVVRDAAGRPFQHLAWGGALETAWTVSGGRAVVEGIPAGQWTVEATAADGRVFSAVAVTTGGPDVEVTLR